ncbi:MAG: (Na+)-NQR maturation NqrM [Pseudomonadales bacterium]|jgi:hypothetical protein
MMTLMLLAFGFMLFIVIAMAVGVLLGRKPISGSCGGLSAIGMKSACDVCGGNDEVCEKEKLKKSQSGNVNAKSLTYNAAELDKKQSQ